MVAFSLSFSGFFVLVPPDFVLEDFGVIAFFEVGVDLACAFPGRPRVAGGEEAGLSSASLVG